MGKVIDLSHERLRRGIVDDPDYWRFPAVVIEHGDEDHINDTKNGLDIMPINDGFAFLVGDLSAHMEKDDAVLLARRILEWVYS